MGAPAPAKSPVKSRAATKVRTAASPARSPSRPKRGVQRLSVLGASGHSRRRTPVCKLTNLYIIASLSGHVSVSRYAEQEGKFILTDGLSRVTVALSTVTLCATMHNGTSIKYYLFFKYIFRVHAAGVRRLRHGIRVARVWSALLV